MSVMPSAAFAHTNATSQSSVDIALSSNLKGVVIDKNKTPIDFVNVVLLKADSTYLAGTVICITNQNIRSEGIVRYHIQG